MKTSIILIAATTFLLLAVVTSAQDCVDFDTATRISAAVPLDFSPRNIVIQNDLAYVVGGPLGVYRDFQILDISNPGQPQVVGSTAFGGGGTFVGLDVSGTQAFLASGGYFLVVDVADPAAPAAVGSVVLPFTIREVRATADPDFVLAAGTDDLVVVDISNPSSPVLSTSLGLTDGAWDIDLLGTTAYLVGPDNFNIVDVANPASPALLGTQALSSAGYRVAAGNGVAYVAAWDPDYGIYAFDVSDPAAPVQVGYHAVGYPRDVAVDFASDRIAVAGSYLEVIDVSDPANMDAQRVPGMGPERLAVAAGHVWTLESSVGNHLTGLALGTTGVISPEIVAPTPIWKVDVSGGTGYALAAENSRFYVDVLDVSGAPPYPPALGRVEVGLGSQTVKDLAHDDDLIAAAFDTWVKLVDAADPAAPVLAGTVLHGSAVRGVALGGGYLYLTDSNGLWAYDVSDPAAPIQVGSLPIAYSAQQLALAADLLYIADENWGLRIVDVSDPTQPATRGLLDEAYLTTEVMVAGNHAYLGKNFNLATVDVTDPDNPQLTGQSALPGYLQAMAIQGDRLAVAVGPMLLLYDLTDPGTPVVIGSGGSLVTAYAGVALAGDRVLVAMLSDGLGSFAPSCSLLAGVNEGPVAAMGPALRASPNPFNPATSIGFSLDNPARVSLRVYSADGRLVTELANGHLDRGNHSYRWDGRDGQGRRASSGLYLMRLSTPAGMQTGRMMMVK